MTTVGHLIHGQPAAGFHRTQPIYDPATGAVIRQVALADRATVEQAIAAAAAAWPAWRATPPARRARVFFRLRQLLEEQAGTIAALVTQEHGKVLGDAMGELQRGIENVDYACGVAELLKGEHSRELGVGLDAWSEFQPLGVVAGITPFNFPAMVPLWMWPIAVACGNTFVLKPSERDPSSALRIAELAHAAGLPAGVLNVVNGDAEAVQVLLRDARVQAVSFVGSTAVAEQIYAVGCAHGKRVQALGGAKNHAIVLPDANMDQTAAALIGAAFGSCGERCMAVPVVIAVGDAVAEALIDRLRAGIAALRVGPGAVAGNDMGPLVTRAHCDRVRGYVEAGVAAGAELLIDGRGLQVAGAEGGFFLGPCLFDRVTPSMSIYREEIFGPVLALVRVPSLDAAIDLINAHEYGNGACLFTRDGQAARYFADRVTAGMVGINVPLPVPAAQHSFGGWKRSFFGDLGAYGPDAVRFYTRRKTITQRWPDAQVRERASLHFPGSG